MPLATPSLPPLTTIPDGRRSSFTAGAMGVAAMPASVAYSPSVASMPRNLHATRTNRSSNAVLGDASLRPRRSTSEDLGFATNRWSRGSKSEKDMQRTNNYTFSTQQMERLNAAAKSRELRQQQLISASRRRLEEKSDSSSKGSLEGSTAGLPSSRASFSSASSCPAGIYAGVQHSGGEYSRLRHSDGNDGNFGMKASFRSKDASVGCMDDGQVCGTRATTPDEKRNSTISIVARRGSGLGVGYSRKQYSGDNPAEDSDGEEEDCKVGIALPSTRKRGRGRKYDDYDTDEELIDSMYDNFDYHDKDDFHSLPSRALRSMANVGDSLVPSSRQSWSENKETASVSIPPPSSSASIPQPSPRARKQEEAIPTSIVTLTTAAPLTASSSGYSHPLTLASAQLGLKSSIPEKSSNGNDKHQTAETKKRASDSEAASKGTVKESTGSNQSQKKKSIAGLISMSESPSPRRTNEKRTDAEEKREEPSDKDSCISGKAEEGYDASSSVESTKTRKRKQSEESRNSLRSTTSAPNASSRRLLEIHDKLNMHSDVLLQDGSVPSDSSLQESGRGDSRRLRRTRSGRPRQSSRRRNTTATSYVRATAPGAVQVSGRAFGFDPSIPLDQPRRGGLTQLAASSGNGESVGENNDRFDADASANFQHPPIEATTVVDIEQPPVCVKAEAMQNGGKSVQRVRTVVFCFAVATVACVSVIVALLLSDNFGSRNTPDDSVRWDDFGNHDQGFLNQSSPTAAPTLTTAPTGDFSSLMRKLEQYSRVEDLEAEGSPQNCAFRWILRHDRQRLDQSGPKLIQRYALTVIYYATNSINCTKEIQTRSDATLVLDPLTQECMWGSAVECENRGERAVVTGLDLSRSDLDGTLPPEIGLLSYLESVCFRENRLRGQIPSEIGLLTKLGHLELHDNRFDGTIPSSVGNLKTLDELVLSSNSFTGAIPDEVYSLNELRLLDLSRNHFSGRLSEKLINLKLLNKLSVVSNHLTGTLPPALGLLNNLAFVHCDNNYFNGTLYNIIGVTTYRQEITVSNNKLTGTIPGLHLLNEAFDSIIRTLPLRKVDMSRNQLHGKVDNQKVYAPNLEFLNYSSNQLSGPLPEFDTAPNLKFIDIHSNRFTGTVPFSWGKTKNIEQLDLSYNMLEGSLPPSIGNHSHLESAKLRGCNFTGTLPGYLGDLTRLQHLDLGMNALSGPIPSILGRLSFLGELHFDRNIFTGTIPSTLGRLRELRALSLESNKLVGTIPSELTSLSNLETLDLANNDIVGAVPSGLCGLHNKGKLGMIQVDDEIECTCECNTPDVATEASAPPKSSNLKKTGSNGKLFHFHGYNQGTGTRR